MFTDGVKGCMVGTDDLEMVGIVEKVELTACDTDFSQHKIGKVGFLISKKDRKYLAMKVWDDKNELINQTTFWTSGTTDELVWEVQSIPEGEEIIGVYANNENEMKLMSLGFMTWKPNPNAVKTPSDDITSKMFRKTAMWGYTDTPTDVSSKPEFNELWHCRCQHFFDQPLVRTRPSIAETI